MSKVEGKTLKSYLDESELTCVCIWNINKKLLDLDQDEKIGLGIGDLVGQVHAAGFVHGDLTTSNFLFDEKNSKFSIIDFGLSTTSNKEESRAVDLHVLEKVNLKLKRSKFDCQNA